MVVLLDDQFLIHSAVHKAVLRLLRNCVGDDLQEQLDGRNKVMGAARNAVRSSPSEYEEDLVNLLCILCSRIRNYRELLMIFFHDKQWYRSEPLFAVEEEEEYESEEEQEEGEERDTEGIVADASGDLRSPSPTPSQATVTSAPASSLTKKPEYEFLLFNYLLRFVHREGQIGDFARAGLLFLVDVAMSAGEPMREKTSGSSTLAPASEPLPGDPITDAALALAEYILDGDFSEVLGAGLSAVYSLLPSKLEIRPSVPSDASEGNVMFLGSRGPETDEEKETRENEEEKSRALGLEDSTNPDFKARLDHFLKLLEFLQDVIRRNVIHEISDSNLEPSALVGTAIVQSILDAVRRIFLENVLYPSILECSDTDGSAVAVMSYIEIMIRDLGDGEMAELLVDFLTTEDNDDLSQSQIRHPMLTLGNGSIPPRARRSATAEKLKRRKSSAMMLLEMGAPDSKRQSEYFTSMGRFTLKDLLMTNLRCKSQATATAALQLFQSMLLQHCHDSVNKLLVVFADAEATSFPFPTLTASSVPQLRTATEDDDDDETFFYPGGNDSDPSPEASFASGFAQPQITYSTHEREMGLYLTLVSRVDPSHSGDAFSTGYEHYLRDALISIQGHSCFTTGGDAASRAKFKHRLNPNDPILTIILDAFRKFFANSPDFNMALTGVLATLAICPDRSLAGWLTFSVGDSEAPDPLDGALESKGDGDDRSIDFGIDQSFSMESFSLPASRMDDHSRPVVHTIFHGLVAQLDRYREIVVEFDKFLLERRQGLLFSENLTDALTLALEFEPGVAPKATIVSPIAAPESSASRPKPKPTKTSSFVSFLTPKKNKTAKAAPAPEPITPPRTGNQTTASPFAPHYKKTGAITVEPFIAPIPSVGPWTPAKRRNWNVEEEDVFMSSGRWNQQSPSQDEGESDEDYFGEKTATTVTLSRLLDNVVILEESLKELAAIIHARRSLGIDAIRYI
ncbi:hypothetical protein JAAARDRAFT_563762 [Jaapia argillacea MUCL 33604]|uniref:FHF complex subunit HOOK-interacting protein C-terminal domain-containing protein n=1 Tax=Jaapia argillacea MUCL 33604 TaxID=933084 RepID=A0A067QE17_9AGAM|nr:hypothetical protein JAAARDRAFT_563762 [Jaapia argillacea MUCL 33604]